MLKNSGAGLHVFLAFGVLIGDEKALMQVLMTKGATGRLQCFYCKNVLSEHGASMLARAATDALPISSLDLGRMQQHTDDSVRALLGELQAAKPVLPKGRYAELETSKGFTYSAKSLLMCAALTIGFISSTMLDWMHVYVVHGVFGWEVAKLMRSLKEAAKELRLPPQTYADLSQ